MINSALSLFWFFFQCGTSTCPGVVLTSQSLLWLHLAEKRLSRLLSLEEAGSYRHSISCLGYKRVARTHRSCMLFSSGATKQFTQAVVTLSFEVHWQNFLFFCGDLNLNWTRAYFIFFSHFPQHLGLSEFQGLTGGSARSVAPADWLDFSSTQEWPLQGLITSLRGGHTGCTISPTSISPSSRSTTLSSRRRRATSRSVTASVRKGARSFHKNLSGGGSNSGGHWLSNTSQKQRIQKQKLNLKYFFFFQ